MVNLIDLRTIAEVKFPDIVESTTILDERLRVVLIDDSYIDFWWSFKIPNRFAFHWEPRHVDGTIYLHANAHHTKWQNLVSFPQHFHYQSDSNVIESSLSSEPESAIREFLDFARKLISQNQIESG